MANTVYIFFPQSDAGLDKIVQDAGLQFHILSNLQTIIELAAQEPAKAIVVDTAQNPAVGLKAIRDLHQHPATGQSPILAITPPDPDARSEALEAGASEFLSAPLDWLEVRIRLRSLSSIASHAPAPPVPSIEGDELVQVSKVVDLLHHDLTGPQNIIYSGLEIIRELLADELENPAQIFSFMDNMMSASQRQNFLTRTMLEWIRMYNPEFIPGSQPFNPHEAVQDGVDTFLDYTPRRDVSVEVVFDDDLPDIVGDKQLFEHVITASLDTAAKFCMPNQKITVTVSQQADGVEVKISDPGRPVRPAYTDNKIFQIRLMDKARQEDSRSTVGMSLPFIQRAMQIMNGVYSLDSNPNSDTTTLSLWLPAAG
jgi:signal transduction histidine kinase